MKAFEKVLAASEKDPSIFADRAKMDETFGHNPDYLFDVHGITKSDLIRLERIGLAVKTRYEMSRKDCLRMKEGPITGTHRVRWVLFREAA